MEKVIFTPPLHGISQVTLDFIEKLSAVTPENLDFIKPFSGGSGSIVPGCTERVERFPGRSIPTEKYND